MSSVADNDDDDRISNLPETLICHILSFLPTKQAVATSVLAKRWIHLWCSVLAINFSNTELYHQEACFRFSESVYSVLLSRNSIKSFCLGITYGEEGIIGFPHVVKWVNHVVQSGVETIDLLVDTMFGGGPKLPISILSCKTLVVLKFQRFSVKGFSSIRLPCLKILHLSESGFFNIQDFMLLLVGCPILEELQAHHIGFRSEDSLTYQERNSSSLSLSKLTRADMVCFYCHFPLTALRNVEFLCIQMDEMYRPHDEIPTFHNLTHLTLLSLNYNWKLLVHVLSHCPKLQKLDLSEATEDCIIPDVLENWVDPKFVPHCISLNLRTCTLLRFKGLQGELLMAKYILKNARVLQTMTIRGPSPVDYILAQVSVSHFNFEYIERELFSFPRVSATCQLSVYKE